MGSPLFDLPARATRAGDSFLAGKVKKTKQVKSSIRGGDTLLEKIQLISAMVQKNIGKYADRYEIIAQEDHLEDYIDSAINNGIISIDTETSGLNILESSLVGLCLFTPNKKAAYVPIGHVSYVTNMPLDEQLDIGIVAQHLKKLQAVKVVMFNAKFDMRVIKHNLGVEINPYWDSYIAARLLNENEPSNGLKALHNKYCLGGGEDFFAYDDLFKGISFNKIPINTAYLYAARDAEITYELYQFQKPFLTASDSICQEKELQDVANVFHSIEMPLVPVVAEMENMGIAFDRDYANELYQKYSEQLKEIENEFLLECAKYTDKIDDYYHKNIGNSKLSIPINIGSPLQIAILLYDIIGVETIDRDKPRGTGEEILLKINKPIAKIILKYREVAKLLSTYIEKLPNEVNSKTGRIHASFNQMGTDTGRFSSSDPNMQNIPAQNNDIRKMFVATDGYYLLSSDYSAQEPRLTAHMSQDYKMIQAYKDGKDLYAEMASLAFGVPYDECKEFRSDGTQNKKGKERRNHAKAIFLGICYGKGVKAIGEDLNISAEKAQQIYDSVLRQFKGLRKFMIDSETMAKEKGFVTTLWGRKRRLTNMLLDPYEFDLSSRKSKNFDPLFDDCEDYMDDTDPIIHRYYTQLINARGYKAKEIIKKRALEDGIKIKDNGAFIAEATRQCVNSRIQGSAADQTKKAMILVGNDYQLKKLGFRLLLTVHDELIGECPKGNVKEVAERFSGLMIEAAKELCVPSKCDIEITDRWYGGPIGG